MLRCLELRNAGADIDVAGIAVVGGSLHQRRLLTVIEGNLLHVVK